MTIIVQRKKDHFLFKSLTSTYNLFLDWINNFNQLSLNKVTSTIFKNFVLTIVGITISSHDHIKESIQKFTQVTGKTLNPEHGT